MPQQLAEAFMGGPLWEVLHGRSGISSLNGVWPPGFFMGIEVRVADQR